MEHGIGKKKELVIKQIRDTTTITQLAKLV